MEFGKYNTSYEALISRNWRCAGIKLKYNPKKDNGFSIYSKLGNVLFDDVYTNSFVLGSDLKIKTYNDLDVLLEYEYSKNYKKSAYSEDLNKSWIVHYFKQSLVYTLPNAHKLSISSHFNKPMAEKKEKAFLLTYTMPLDEQNVSRAMDSFRNMFRR